MERKRHLGVRPKSPTTTVIDAQENRDIMTADIPNAFIQAQMPEIKMTGKE